MGLADEIEAVRAAARKLADEGEEVVGVVPAEPNGGRRIYLCAYAVGDSTRWLALDGAGDVVVERGVVRDAVSIAALCELAEETAGGGDVARLRERLAEIRETENPEGIEEAEAAAAALEETFAAAPRVATVEYLDALGLAATRLEQALGGADGSSFGEAMKVGVGAAQELASEVERSYKTPLA